MDRPNRPPPSSVRESPSDRQDGLSKTHSLTRFLRFLLFLTFLLRPSFRTTTTTTDGRSWLSGRWKGRRRRLSGVSPSFFPPFQFSPPARAPSQPLDYPSFLSASFHRQSDMEGGEKKSHPPPHCSPRQCLRRRCRSTLGVIITTTKGLPSPISSRLIDSVTRFCSL